MKRRKASRGIGMAIALYTLAIITAITFGLGAIGIADNYQANYQKMDMLAARAADAGIDYFNYLLNNEIQTSGWSPFGGGAPSTPIDLTGSPTTGTVGPQFLNQVQGAFSVTYYNNLVDAFGFPTTTACTTSSIPPCPIYVPPASIGVISTGIYRPGTFGAVSRRAAAIYMWKSPISYALGSVNSLGLSGSVDTDSYNSNNGVYSVATRGYNGNVGTNFNGQPALTIGGSATIRGVATVGIGGTVAGATGSNPTGGWIECDGCVDTTLSTAPAGACTVPPAGGCATDASAVATTCATPLAPGKYGNLTFSGSYYLTAGNYSFSTITLNTNATLYIVQSAINPTAPTKIYLSNGTTPQGLSGTAGPQLKFGNNAEIRVIPGTCASTADTNKSPNMLFLGTSILNCVDFGSGNGGFTMSLHAPAAFVANPSGNCTSGSSSYGTKSIYGSIVIQTLSGTATGNVSFHADEALLRTFTGKPVLVKALQFTP